LINLVVTIIGIVFLSTGFVGQFKKKLLLSIMVYGIMFVIDLLAAFLLYEAPDSNNYEIVSSFISVMFFYIVVIGIKKVFKENGKVDLSGQWYLLLFSALLSIAALYIVYKDMVVSRVAVITISIIVLFFNIMLYIFYISMLDRFLYERENLELKQQMNIYEKQMRNDIDNNKKIRTIRHDMKHHIREINDLLTKNKVEQAKEYLIQINNDIVNAQNIYNTGNDAFDGILNFYAEKYINKSLELEVAVAIPENLEINIYDVNIILGNLLDNALENATDGSKVNLDIKYNAGMLHISICNLYDGNIKRIDGNILSKKGENHGFGLGNIKRIADKYDGSMLVKYENGKFNVDIIMYIS
jgi:signal transduction histidine kinase